MSTDSKFAPRSLTASEYVRRLFGPEDNAAILARNRSTGHAVQTIAKAETIASPDFQSWLAGQSASGYDVFLGMNPIKDGAFSRTKGNIKDIRHVYLDLDRKGDQALEAIHSSGEVPPPNFVLDTCTRSCGKWAGSVRTRPRLSSTTSQTNSAAIWRRRTRHACCAYRDLLTINSPRNLSSRRGRKAMLSTPSATSPLTKTRPKRLDTLASTKNASGWCPTTTKVNPSNIGLMRSEPSPAATIPKSLFSASPTTVRKTRPIRSITHATPSKKREPLSTRSGEMFNLSRKPQFILLRAVSGAKGRLIRGDIVPF